MLPSFLAHPVAFLEVKGKTTVAMPNSSIVVLLGMLGSIHAIALAVRYPITRFPIVEAVKGKHKQLRLLIVLFNAAPVAVATLAITCLKHLSIPSLVVV